MCAPLNCLHRIFGYRIWRAGDTPLTASPSISSSRTRASATTSFLSRSDRCKPDISSVALVAAASMCLMRVSSSIFDIQCGRLSPDAVANQWAEKALGIEIHRTTQDCTQFFLHVDKRQAWNVLWIENHENVDVA